MLKLMYAAVIRAADRWRGLTVGEFEQRQLRAIREELDAGSRRTGAPRRAPQHECVGRQLIQQGPDLTRVPKPRRHLLQLLCCTSTQAMVGVLLNKRKRAVPR